MAKHYHGTLDDNLVLGCNRSRASKACVPKPDLGNEKKIVVAHFLEDLLGKRGSGGYDRGIEIECRYQYQWP